MKKTILVCIIIFLLIFVGFSIPVYPEVDRVYSRYRICIKAENVSSYTLLLPSPILQGKGHVNITKNMELSEGNISCNIVKSTYGDMIKIVGSGDGLLQETIQNAKIVTISTALNWTNIDQDKWSQNCCETLIYCNASESENISVQVTYFYDHTYTGKDSIIKRQFRFLPGFDWAENCFFKINEESLKNGWNTVNVTWGRMGYM